MALRDILEREMSAIIMRGGVGVFSRDGDAMAELLRASLSGEKAGHVYFGNSDSSSRARDAIEEWAKMKSREESAASRSVGASIPSHHSRGHEREHSEAVTGFPQRHAAARDAAKGGDRG